MNVQTNKKNYCVDYRCKINEGWKVGFHACVCPDKNVFSEMISQVRNSTLQNSKQFFNESLCCESTLFTQQVEEGGKIELTCPMDKTQYLV